MSFERLTHIEVEDEDGNTQVLTVKRFITQDFHDPTQVFSSELIFRPGGGAIAKRVDNRVQTLADDAIGDAFRRQEEEIDRLREEGQSAARAGMTQARTGGESAIVPDEQRTPGRRPRRGSRAQEKPPEEQQDSAA